MKCIHCKVELGDQHKRCPLCGAEAIAHAPRVADHTADYPYITQKKSSRRKKEKTSPISPKEE